MRSRPPALPRARHWLRLLPALLLIAAGLNAQEITATLSGTVKDASGGILPKANVTAVQIKTGATRSTTSTSAGAFVFNSLPIGEYSLTVEMGGFKKFHMPSLALHVNDKVRVEVSLELGNLTEEITVEASAAQLQTETAELSNLVGSDQIKDMPLNGRSFNQLVDLVPGVSPDGDSRVSGGVGLNSDTAISINGNLSNSNLFLLDGEYNMDSGANSNLLATPSVDAVEEFKILRNNFSAEFGGATGGVINVVTKSGSQQFHGSAFEYARHDALDATDPFLRAAGEKKSKLRQHNFGMTVGGPIWFGGYNKDRSSDFFFFSFEGRRETRGNAITATVPTARQRQGVLDPNCEVTGSPCQTQPHDPYEAVLNEPNVDPSHIDPNATAFLDRYPLPNTSFEDNGFNYIKSADQKTNENQFLARWDHHFGNKAILTVRYVQMVQKLDDLAQHPWTGDNSFSVTQDWKWDGKNAIIKLTNLLTPHLVNDFQIGYSSNALSYVTGKASDPRLATREGFTYTELFPETTGSYPTLNGIEVFSSLANASPFKNRTDNYQIKDDVAFTFGNHNLKTGAFFRVNKKQEPANGGFNLTAGTFTFATYEDFLNGHASTYQEEQTQNDVYPQSHDFAVYIQDSWRILKNLTLDLGFRYQYMNQPYSSKDNTANFRPNQYDPGACSVDAFDENGLVNPALCAPSNGMVTPTTTGVNRSMLTDYYDGWEPRVGFAWRPGSSDRLVVRGGFGIFHGRDAISHISLLGTHPPANRNPIVNDIAVSDIAAYDVNTPQPPLGLEALAEDYRHPVSRQFSLGFQAALPFDTTIEVNYVGVRGKNLGRNRNINQVPDASRLEVVEGLINPDTVRPYLGYSLINYNQRVGWSRYNALQVYLNKRMTHGFGFQVAYAYGKNEANTSNQDTEYHNSPLQDTNNPQAEEAVANQDITHSLVVNYVWELPFFKNSKGLTKALLGGWNVAGITMWRTGLPATVCLDQDVAGTGTGGWYECQRPNLTGDPNLAGGDSSVDRWFNTGAFSVPEQGQFGNAGRNLIRLPGIYNWDVSVYKNFEVPWFGGSLASKNATLQFRADFFNVWNHTQYSGVDTTLLVSENIENTRFGKVTGARSPREIQLSLRLMW